MSDEREPNNRSDAALRERLEIAGKATKGPWKSDVIPPEMVGARPRYVIRDGKGIVIVEDVHHFASWQKTGLHIAASSPDVVRADIEEILRLRQDVARLNEVSHYLAERLSPLNVTRRKYIGATLEDGYGNDLFLTREEAIQSWLDEANREVNRG